MTTIRSAQSSLELDTPFGIMIGKSSSASVFYSSSKLLGMAGAVQRRDDVVVDTEFLRKVELCQQVDASHFGGGAMSENGSQTSWGIRSNMG